MRIIDFKTYLKAFNKANATYYMPGNNSYLGNEILHKELSRLPIAITMNFNFMLAMTIICPIIGIIMLAYFCSFNYISKHSSFKVYWCKQEENLHIQHVKCNNLDIPKYYQPYYGYKEYTGEDDEKFLIKNYINYKLLPFIITVTSISIIIWSILIFT